MIVSSAQRTRTATACAVAIGAGLFAGGPPDTVTRDPAWEAVLFSDEGLTGADGGASLLLPGDRVLWTLADSIIGQIVDGRHGPGSAIVNNAIVLHPLGRPRDVPPPLDTVVRRFGPEPRPGANSGWLMPDGQAGPVENAAAWYWPTGGGIITEGANGGHRLNLFYTRLTRRGGDAEGTVWNFHAQRSALAVIDNPGDDPDSWHIAQHDLGPIEQGGRRINWGVAALSLPATGVLVLGVDDTDTLNKKLVAARIEDGVLDDPDRWRYWGGHGWAGERAAAAVVCEHVTDELSLHREGPAWVMVHMEANLGRRIMARTAADPLGPWSDPRPLYECPEPAGDARTLVYAARAHPELSSPAELLITYAVNSTDFWHMLSDARTYRLRAIRVPRRLAMPVGEAPAGAP